MEAIRKRVEAAPSDLERFVSEQNIARYRKLLEESKDETQRLTIAAADRWSGKAAEDVKLFARTLADTITP
jgi:hypothetical protein